MRGLKGFLSLVLFWVGCMIFGFLLVLGWVIPFVQISNDTKEHRSVHTERENQEEQKHQSLPSQAGVLTDQDYSSQSREEH
nr:MAG TPA: hypothetical protein [Caudoviricetes sp.]